MTKRKIGIIGYGTVGRAVASVFSGPIIYDKYKKIGGIEEVNEADIIFLCVPTPYKNGFDVSEVDDALSAIRGNKIIVIKSTVLPGTTDHYQEKYPDHRVLFNPEFLREVSAETDMNNPGRQIIGYTKRSRDAAKDVLKILPNAPFRKIIPAKEAEMIKYFGNAFLASKVIFANQMFDLCEKLGINYDIVKECVSKDKRIGSSHLNVNKSSRGYGGKCFPKDVKSLIEIGIKVGIDLNVLKSVDEINNKLNNL